MKYKINFKKDIALISDLYSFDKKLVLIIREAGLNIVKHTKGGEFTFYSLEDKYRLIFDDISDGFDIKTSFKKGFSSSKTLGIGLNLLINIVDFMEIIPKKDGTIFIFDVYKKEKKEYCLFCKEFNNFKAFLKTDPFLSITTCGDCGIFENTGKKFLFALWDIEGHGSQEVYLASKKLKKLILAFKHFDIKESINIINYLFCDSRRASLIIGEIKDKIFLYQFGNVNFLYNNSISQSAMGIFGMKILKKKEYILEIDDIALFSDGIRLNKIPYSYEGLSQTLKNKELDDASILSIKVRK